MSFRDEVNNTAKTVMIDAFITRMFSEPHRRFGDILEDLIEVDDPDDDWMRDTLYELEIGQFIRAGMKVMGFGADDDIDIEELPIEMGDDDEDIEVTETEEGTEYSLPGTSDEDSSETEEKAEDSPAEDTEVLSEEEVEAAAEEEPKKKKKKKKKPKNTADASDKKKKKKNKSIPAKSRKKEKVEEEREEDPEWKDYKKLIIKALRANKAYDVETAVNNSAVLNHIHGEDSWDKDESADLRRGMDELIEEEKTDKTGQRRGTRYHLR